jgi:hypothetical protein
MNTRQPLALFMKSNKGYYVSLETFIDHPSKTYYIPSKGMGMDPFEMKYGPTLMVLKNRLTTVLKNKPYCVGKKKIPIQLFYCLVVALIKMFLNNYKDKTS